MAPSFCFVTRFPVQGSACKDLSRNGQGRAITLQATSLPLLS
ncbi:hypothetical protein LRHMDP2_1359 [Lacticaseibacillus rhamnosus LRHMDP2]|uniref:Malolactic regulator n=1 Tax=Lacticaseibacillus rhamnosus LRHMDP3 TaxID=1203259 RepID=A0AB33XVC1_LACRH|nr:hypothetical protein LRHMDP3_1490 [Lacticaseibacillus rhamnosus LRHMDP3]EKS51577.1 hypothetical protein LRHMDP2_1359 [Lacticaseibacillus rhamnosus LRHMDP2]